MRPVTDGRVAHAHAIDIHVGARVRARRKALKLSQIHLAQPLDLTFQQVQKYERGANRISASKLYEIAQVLKVPVSFFFDGYVGENPTGSDSGPGGVVDAFLHSTEGLDLCETFLRLPTAEQRKRVLDLMSAL